MIITLVAWNCLGICISVTSRYSCLNSVEAVCMWNKSRINNHTNYCFVSYRLAKFLLDNVEFEQEEIEAYEQFEPDDEYLCVQEEFTNTSVGSLRGRSLNYDSLMSEDGLSISSLLSSDNDRRERES